MSDILRKTYARLMGEVEDLEDEIDKLEKDSSSEKSELDRLREELIEKRNELARVSDGCGHSYHN